MREEIKQSMDNFFKRKKYSTEHVKKEVISHMAGYRSRQKVKKFYVVPLIATAALLILVTTLIISQQESKQTADDNQLESLQTELNDTKDELGVLEAEKRQLQLTLDRKESEHQQLQADNRELKSQLSEHPEQGLVIGDDMFIQNLLEVTEEEFPTVVAHIKESLKANEEDIIPLEGILGGTPSIIEDSITILSHEWVLANFGDGHYLGMLLLKYSMEDGEVTSWEVIDYYPEN